MMGAFGRFLEVSIPAPDVLRSLAFYRALGFAELTTGDIRPWHYAVVTDGHIALGLQGAGGVEEPALTFVRPNLARQVEALERAGQAFEFRRLGAEEFHEAGLRSPDGLLILMIEARTWSPGTPGGHRCLVRCTEVTVNCADVGRTRAFFESAGFLAAGADEEPVRLHTPGIVLGLRDAPPAPVATLRFAPESAPALRTALAALELAPKRIGADQVVKAPEGTRLVVE
jgi:catechol 2,3-dioxygenase-like lactoylglutathione lyase family enzyme